MSTVDVLIAIPVIPLFLFAFTWWPWRKLPSLISGPYMLYVAFAAWYFHFSGWVVLTWIVAGVSVTTAGVVEATRTTLPSTTDKKFLKTLEDWLRGQSEIMILIRYSREAGNKSFEFFTSFAALRDRLARLKAGTNVIAFRKRQLPLRGLVDDEFIEKCMRLIPVGSEFLVLETDPRMATQQWMYHHKAGESHDGLQQVLEGLRGRLVAVGEYPPWQKCSPEIISAYVPHEDGSVKVGAY